MKRLLFNSTIVLLWSGMVFFSCADRGKEKTEKNPADTTLQNLPATGDPATAGQSDTVKRTEDTALYYNKAINHMAPGQSRIDSIKNAKTSKKK